MIWATGPRPPADFEMAAQLVRGFRPAVPDRGALLPAVHDRRSERDLELSDGRDRGRLTFQIASQLGWHSRYGAIFADGLTDQRVVPIFGALTGAIMVLAGIELYRQFTRVRPAPASQPSLAT
jgi:hypothetical protein